MRLVGSFQGLASKAGSSGAAGVVCVPQVYEALESEMGYLQVTHHHGSTKPHSVPLCNNSRLDECTHQLTSLVLKLKKKIYHKLFRQCFEMKTVSFS